MNLLHRYIFRAVLSTCLFGVGLFVFIILSANALRDVVGHLFSGSVNVVIFSELLGLLLPYCISFALPLGMLIGVLLVLGRMSAQQEITAMKASGISLWRISAPILFIAVIGSIFSTTVNSYYAPNSRSEYKDMLRNVASQDPLRFIIPKTFITDFPKVVVYLGERNEETLENLWVWELGKDKQAVRLYRAEFGEIRFDEEKNAISLVLDGGFVEVRNEKDPSNLQINNPVLYFKNTSFDFPLDKIFKNRNKEIQSIEDIKLSTEHIGKLIKWRDSLKIDLKELKTAPPSLESVQQIEATEKYLTLVKYQLQRNLAMGFAVLSLTFVGIPLGLKASRSETYANIGLALCLALVYYAFMMAVDFLEAKSNLHPEFLVWIPNIVFQTVGFFLIRRADKH